MNLSSVARGLVPFVVVSVCACGGPRQNLVGYPVARQRVSIKIEISDQVNEADDDGGVATLAETVSAGLKENGIDSQLYTSKYDKAPAPRIELNVLFWHGTSPLSHKFAAGGYVVPGLSAAALATAGNRMIVDCSVFLPNNPAAVYQRRFDQFGIGAGLTATDGLAAASNAGNAIVDAVLTSGPKLADPVRAKPQPVDARIE